ncbi:MAG: phosphatase PAP2 family protein [Sphingobium sp.]|nr:phosphatase PAP2 family protein [Sphingobium sp.]
MGACCISDRASRWRGAAALVAALALVLVLALLQRWGILTPVNHMLMAAAGRARDTVIGGPVTPLMQAASLLGGTTGRLTILAFAAILLTLFGRVRVALWLVVVVLGGALLNLALKQVFAAPRPDLLPHLDIVHTYSFPSGHAAGNLILFGALAMAGGRGAGWAAAIPCIVVIGISRVWLGVHWPNDVAAGWIEGTGWLLFCAAWRPMLDSGGRAAYRAGAGAKDGEWRA